MVISTLHLPSRLCSWYYGNKVRWPSITRCITISLNSLYLLAAKLSVKLGHLNSSSTMRIRSSRIRKSLRIDFSEVEMTRAGISWYIRFCLCTSHRNFLCFANFLLFNSCSILMTWKRIYSVNTQDIKLSRPNLHLLNDWKIESS